MRVIANSVLLAALLISLANAGDIPDAPAPKQPAAVTHHSAKAIVFANVVMWSSAVVAAHATHYGTRQCLNELQPRGLMQEFGTPFGGGLFHPWRKSFTITVPVDASVTLASFLLHRHHRDGLAALLPSAAASAQFAVAGELYVQGCI